jgi:hypothetical protein
MLTRSMTVCVALSCAMPGGLIGQQLSGCGTRDSQRIESFTITLPTTIDRAYTITVQAFMTSGFVPSRTWWHTNEVEWESLEDENFFDGARRTRFIRAVLFETDSGTIINLSAREKVRAINSSRIRESVLSNKNRGTGYKVWCGARRISDSLSSMAVRESRGGEEVVAGSDVAGDRRGKLEKRELWLAKRHYAD